MSYDNLKLEKGLYTCSGGFSDALESLDPSQNYVGTELESLDAFERQLKRFDIRVSGAQSDVVEKFFKTSDSATLFPEYINRTVLQGIAENDQLSSMVATVTEVQSNDYRSIYSSINDMNFVYEKVNEGTHIPETTIKARENLITLKKHGSTLVSSYETLRLQKLDLFAITLKKIGAYISNFRNKEAIDVLLNGDGSYNTATEVDALSTSGLAYKDLLELWSNFTDYNLTTIVASPKTLAKILAVSEMSDASAGLNFHSTGELITPFGAKLIKSTGIEDDKILAFDKTCTLQQVQVGGLKVEFDKLIDRQLERAAITSITGFAKINDDSCYYMDIN